jgi:serine protease
MSKPSRVVMFLRSAGRWARAAALAVATVMVLVPVAGQERGGQQGQERRLDRPVEERRNAEKPANSRVPTRAGRSLTDPQHAMNVDRAVREGLPYVPGEVLVKYRSTADAVDRTGALNTLRLDRARSNARWVGDLQLVVSQSIDDPEHAAWLLRQQPEVVYAQPNYRMQTQHVPNDPGWPQQWHLQLLHVPEAWDINWGATSGRKVTVAVLDTGLTMATGTYSFPIPTEYGVRFFDVPMARPADFNNNNVLPGRDFAFKWSMLFDGHGHGTHVAAIIAQQTDNGAGYAGIAHGVTLLPVKVCGSYWDYQLDRGYRGISGYYPLTEEISCWTSDVIEGLIWAVDSGAQVVNASIAGTSPNPAYRDALRYAVDHGALVAVPTGDEARNGNPTMYPAAYAPQIDGVVAVGAVNREFRRAYYSSYGPYVEIAAPGGDVKDIWQMSAVGVATWSTSPRFDLYASRGFQGTSMASAYVAGLAALLYNQGITKPAAIEAALKRFATDRGPLGRDDEYGYGIIDPRASLRGIGWAR